MNKAALVILVLLIGAVCGFYLGGNVNPLGSQRFEQHLEKAGDGSPRLDSTPEPQEANVVAGANGNSPIMDELENEKRRSAKLQNELDRILKKLDTLEKTKKAAPQFATEQHPWIRLDEENRLLEIESDDVIELEKGRKFLFGKTREIAGDLKSKTGEEKAILHFENNTGDWVYLMWIDYNGKPVPYDKIAPGSKGERATFMTHPWVIVDSEGNRIGGVEPVYKEAVEEIVIQN